MPADAMKQLSSLDAPFRHLETPEMPMHAGARHLLEPPAGYRGKFVVDLRRHMAQPARGAGAATPAVVDAAQPSDPGVGRRRA